MKSPCSSCPRKKINAQCPDQNYVTCNRWRGWFRQHWRRICDCSEVRAAQIDHARSIARMNRFIERSMT